MSSGDDKGPRRPGPRRGRGKKGGPRPIVRRGTVRLHHDVARRIRAGHPWVYREALGQRAIKPRPGSTIELVDWDGDFVAKGFYDGETAIAVRVMTRSPKGEIGPELITKRVRSAVGLRRRFIDFDQYEAVRLVNAEADGLPGIVVDRYADYLVVQLFTESVSDFREPLYEALKTTVEPKAIYEQKRFRSLAGEGPRQGAALVHGPPAPVELEVKEGDLRFWVDVTAPLSTGLFADLRLGRRAVRRWAKDRRVLNLFSYTGSISVYAAHGGAREVCAVDVAAKAHARARKNFALNGFDAEKPEHVVGDAFKVMARFADRDREFDMVIIDPPAFASASRGGKSWSAVKDYGELVAAALDLMPHGSCLIAASTTHKLSSEDFDMSLAQGSMLARRRVRIVERCPLPVDFPTSPGFPEGNYLKFVVAIVD